MFRTLLLSILASFFVAGLVGCDDRPAKTDSSAGEPAVGASAATPSPPAAPRTSPPPATAEPPRVEVKTEGLVIVSPPSKAPEGAEKALGAVVGKYLELKDALVEGAASDARTAAKAMAYLSTRVPAEGLDPDAAAAWSGHRKVMKAALTTIILVETDLAGQRAALNGLTDATYAAARSFGLKGWVVQFCPMANSGAGGYWLSAERAIRNPYFGDAMLECGEVREVL